MIQRAGEAVIFDLGGVLIDWSPEYLFRKMFDGNEAEMAYFLSTVCPLEWNEEQDAGRSFAVAIEERSKLYPEYATYIEAYHGRWEEMIRGEISGTVEILSNLRGNGTPLYALSNWSAETYPLVEKRFQFLGWFDEVFISGHVGKAKPDPDFYQFMLDQLNKDAGECLFIDDNKRNILAAEQLGFQVIHFSSPDTLLSELIGLEILSL